MPIAHADRTALLVGDGEAECAAVVVEIAREERMEAAPHGVPVDTPSFNFSIFPYSLPRMMLTSFVTSAMVIFPSLLMSPSRFSLELMYLTWKFSTSPDW